MNSFHSVSVRLNQLLTYLEKRGKLFPFRIGSIESLSTVQETQLQEFPFRIGSIESMDYVVEWKVRQRVSIPYRFD